jgi:hypothetical protein
MQTSGNIFKIFPTMMNHSVADLPPDIVKESQRLAREKGQEIDLLLFSEQWHRGNSLVFQSKIHQAAAHLQEWNRQLETLGAHPLYTMEECEEWKGFRADRDGRQAWDLFYRLKEELIDRLSDLPQPLLDGLNPPPRALQELHGVLEEARCTLHRDVCLCGAPRTDRHQFDLPVWSTSSDENYQLHYLPIEHFLGKQEGDRVTLFMQGARFRLCCRQRGRLLTTAEYSCTFPSPFNEYLAIYEERARRLGYLDSRLAIRGEQWRGMWRRFHRWFQAKDTPPSSSRQRTRPSVAASL